MSEEHELKEYHGGGGHGGGGGRGGGGHGGGGRGHGGRGWGGRGGWGRGGWGNGWGGYWGGGYSYPYYAYNYPYYYDSTPVIVNYTDPIPTTMVCNSRTVDNNGTTRYCPPQSEFVQVNGQWQCTCPNSSNVVASNTCNQVSQCK